MRRPAVEAVVSLGVLAPGLGVRRGRRVRLRWRVGDAGPAGRRAEWTG